MLEKMKIYGDDMENIYIPRTPDIEEEFVGLKNGRMKERMLTVIIQKLVEAKFLEEFPAEHWIEIKVNLWNLLKNRKSLLGESEGYIHPLQPDIDLLFGSMIDNIRKTPLNAVEVKLFRDGKIPKTGSGKGFYAGLDQSLALLIHGIEFIELWHFFLITSSGNEELLKIHDTYAGSYIP